MAEKNSIRYDEDAVFISYSPEDIEWVEDTLRPRLEKSGVKVITGENLTGGATVSLNRERVIADTRRTIVILSPEWVANSWNSFEADLLLHLDPGAEQRKLLPVLLRPTEIPPRIARLTLRDLSDPKRYESRLAQLIRDIEDAVPVPPSQSFPNRWAWLWRQARRRGATPKRVAFVGAGLLLFLLALLQIWPFQPREVWLAQDAMPSLVVMHNTGAGLVAGARNHKGNCPTGEVYRGLAFRSLAPDARWQASRVPDDLLCLRELNLLTNIVTFASFPAAPETVYALTRQRGIVVSRDGGASFAALHSLPAGLSGNNDLGALALAGSPESPIFFVAGAKGGLWRVSGEQWQAVGSGEQCALPDRLIAKSLLVEGARLLVGSERQGLWLIDGEGCRRVDTDEASRRWEYLHLASASLSEMRYVALVRDRELSPQYLLVVLCPLSGDCQNSPWPSSTPRWQGASPVPDLLVTLRPGGEAVWVLADQQGYVVEGDLNGITRRYPRLNRCLFSCLTDLERLPSGELYLLANPRYLPTAKVTDGRFYTFGKGAWPRRIWP